jgi:hypothetical protein
VSSITDWRTSMLWSRAIRWRLPGALSARSAISSQKPKVLPEREPP